MRVFLSWSGERSRIVADALRVALSDMIQGIGVFMSRHDLESGQRWSSSIAKELDSSDFGVLCLTEENLTKPWLLFEAGALSKHVGSRACGLLVGSVQPADITGPLSQFQHQSFDRDGVKQLLVDINSLQESPLNATQLERLFPKHWPELEEAHRNATTLHLEKNEPAQPDLISTLESLRCVVDRVETRVIGGVMIKESGFATPDEPERYEQLLRVLSFAWRKGTLAAREGKSAEEINRDAWRWGIPPSVFRDVAKSHGIEFKTNGDEIAAT